MATIKKAYQAILLALTTAMEADENATIASIINEVTDLAAAKTGSGGGKATAFHRDEAGEVVAIKCYYHKLWMDPRVVEFGKKATSPTGMNNMCKDGVSKWTKQQRDIKQQEAELLGRVTKGDLAVEDIEGEQERIQADAKVITPREDEYGFETLEDCIADSEARAEA